MSEDLTTNDLILRAFETIGKYNPYKPPSGEDILIGLYYLNELLDYFQHNQLYIPFYSEIFFTMTVGKSDYVISRESFADIDNNPLISLNYVNIFYDGISYPVEIVSYDQIDKKVINPNILGQPTCVILQKNVDTSKITFYRNPYYQYECRLRGKTYLSNVLLQDHLREIPGYFHMFLRYALARQLKNIYKSENWTAEQEKEYDDILRAVKRTSDVPRSTDINPTFGAQRTRYDQHLGVLY